MTHLRTWTLVRRLSFMWPCRLLHIVGTNIRVQIGTLQ